MPGATRVWTTSRLPEFRDEVLAQEADGTPFHCVEGEGVSVAHDPGTQQKRSPGLTRRLSCEIPPTRTVAGSPTDSSTAMSSKRRFMGTVGMVDLTALHASAALCVTVAMTV